MTSIELLSLIKHLEIRLNETSDMEEFNSIIYLLGMYYKEFNTIVIIPCNIIESKMYNESTSDYLK